MFQSYKVLNNPPLGWTEGVGFVSEQIIREKLVYPPEEGLLIVVCGPPIFEKIMCGLLARMGYPRDTYYSFSEG